MRPALITLTTQVGKGSRLGDGGRPVRSGGQPLPDAAAAAAADAAAGVGERPERAQLGRRPGRRGGEGSVKANVWSREEKKEETGKAWEKRIRREC